MPNKRSTQKEVKEPIQTKFCNVCESENINDFLKIYGLHKDYELFRINAFFYINNWSKSNHLAHWLWDYTHHPGTLL